MFADANRCLALAKVRTLPVSLNLEQLLQRSQVNDPSITEALVEQYYGYIYRLALSILNDPDEAEDAAQETFISAVLNLDRFRGEASLKTWLYSIALNTCRGQLRRRKARQILSGAGHRRPLVSRAGKSTAAAPGPLPGMQGLRREIGSVGKSLETIPGQPLASPQTGRSRRSARARSNSSPYRHAPLGTACFRLGASRCRGWRHCRVRRWRVLAIPQFEPADGRASQRVNAPGTIGYGRRCADASSGPFAHS